MLIIFAQALAVLIGAPIVVIGYGFCLALGNEAGHRFIEKNFPYKF